MHHDFLSAFVLLLLVLDPFGALPVFIYVMGSVAPERRLLVAARESLIAFAILIAFMLAGQGFLRLMSLSERSLQVGGGVILLIIALRMVFEHGDASSVVGRVRGEPLIFPLAVPLLAGPSAMATVLLLASGEPGGTPIWAAALLLAMTVSFVVLLSARRLQRMIGESVVTAIARLMGLVLTAVATEMILAGLKRYFFGTD
jgi:MarC family membrane protein